MKVITLLSCIYIKVAVATLSCENINENCRCFPDGMEAIEVQCPKTFSLKDKGTITNIEEYGTIKTNCNETMTTFRLDLLPKILLPDATRFEIEFCPAPQNFKEIFDYLTLAKVTFLQFESFRKSAITLSWKHFEGLNNLTELHLNDLNLTLSENVFRETPNLIRLEIERNRNFELKPNIFDNLRKLRVLYLIGNNLETLPDFLFQKLSNLTKLHLWQNNLTSFNGTFNFLLNLISLDVHQNKIRNISENDLKHLVKLQRINLSGNKLIRVSKNLFQNNKELKLVFMSHNRGLKIEDYLFSNFTYLEEVDLSKCNLGSIPEHIFENSQKLNIVNLRGNNLTALPTFIFHGLENLKTLNLENNLLDYLNPLIFKDAQNLKILILKRNRFSTLDIFMSKEPNLLMRYQKQFMLPKIENLDLSENLIKKLDLLFILNSTISNSTIDLSKNLLTTIKLFDLQPFGKTVELKVTENKITKVDLQAMDKINTSGNVVIHLDKNPINCDCDALEFLQLLKKDSFLKIEDNDVNCGSPDNLQNKNFLKLPESELICSKNNSSMCPKNCSCVWRPSDKTFVVDCSFKNLTIYPNLNLNDEEFKFNQTEMHLEGNNLKKGPPSTYKNVTKLFLSQNKIEEIEWLPSNLQVLNLDRNHLRVLNYAMLKILNSSNVLSLTLQKNKWKCECQTFDFTNFLKLNHHKINVNKIICENSETLLVNLDYKNLCRNYFLIYMTTVLLVISITIALCCTLFYCFKQEIKVWLFVHNLFPSLITEKEEDDKKYDAFLSYSLKDEDFVLQNLLPVLESQQNPYKISLRDRDSNPGELITTEITNLILDSRRTVVFLSQSFIENVWSELEFRTAHIEAMIGGKTRVIVVLFDDINVEELDNELKSYLKTNTYLKWEDSHFWNKLKYALPHSQLRKSHKNQKILNVMSCIDEKFGGANQKERTKCDSTILTLEVNNLKKCDCALNRECAGNGPLYA